jgi:2-iminobutanoate/2-iminopropanoate deaminase
LRRPIADAYERNMNPATASFSRTCITRTRGYSNPASPYSPAVAANGSYVFVSGQGPLSARSRRVVRGSLEQQFDLTMRNIAAHLKAAGASLADVVSVRVYLSNNDADTWNRMNKVYRRWFRKDPPARTTIGCQLLGIDVEIDCVAVVPSPNREDSNSRAARRRTRRA